MNDFRQLFVAGGVDEDVVKLVMHLEEGLDVALLGQGRVYAVTLAAQLFLLLAALLGLALPALPFRLARYYVSTTASIALGLWDRLRHGAPGAWEKAEGTR